MSGNLDAISGQIAGHAEMAGLPERALSFYTRAAENAARINAYHNAEMLYARAGPVAERLGRPGDEIMDLYSARGRMLEHAGRYDSAIQLYRDLEVACPERGDTAIERAAIARLVTCYSESNDARDPECAQPFIERGSCWPANSAISDTESWLLWSKMVGDSHYGTAEEAQKAGEASVAIARKHGLQDRLAYVLNDLALNLRSEWRLGIGAGAMLRKLARCFRSRATGRCWLTISTSRPGSTIYAWTLIQPFNMRQQSAEISREIENGWNLSMATLIRGLVRAASGDWGRPWRLWKRGSAMVKRLDFVIAMTLMPSELGRLLRAIGQEEQARVLHEKARSVSQDRAPFLLRAVESQLAMDAFAAGQVEEGQRWLHSVLGREPRGEIGTAWLVLADPACAAVRAAECTGDWNLALEMVLDAIQEAQRRRLRLSAVALHEHGRSLEGHGAHAVRPESQVQ